MTHKPTDDRLPLVFDLDGTVIKDDLSFVLFKTCALYAVYLVPYVAVMFLTERAKAKRYMARKFGTRVTLDRLRFDPAALKLAKQAKAEGRQVELVSGSDQEIVEKVAEHIGLFDYARGSDGIDNLIGTNKAVFLKNRYGNKFLYAGNSKHDIHVWQISAGGYGFRAPSSAYGLVGEDGKRIDLIECAPKRTSLISHITNYFT